MTRDRRSQTANSGAASPKPHHHTVFDELTALINAIDPATVSPPPMEAESGEVLGVADDYLRRLTGVSMQLFAECRALAAEEAEITNGFLMGVLKDAREANPDLRASDVFTLMFSDPEGTQLKIARLREIEDELLLRQNLYEHAQLSLKTELCRRIPAARHRAVRICSDWSIVARSAEDVRTDRRDAMAAKMRERAFAGDPRVMFGLDPDDLFPHMSGRGDADFSGLEGLFTEIFGRGPAGRTPFNGHGRPDLGGLRRGMGGDA